jgi:hypothetical protein
MKTGEIVILGAAGVVLLDYLGVIHIAFLDQFITPMSSGTIAPATTSNTNSTASTQTTTLDAMAALIQKDGMNPATALMSVSKWNFYYNLARGVAGPAPTDLFPKNANADTENFTLQEWWSAMVQAGFSGLGLIAHHVNPYLLGPRTTMHPFGAGCTPTGPETMIKQVN